VFARYGLLVAFSFSGALDRFDVRRTLIVNEATALGAAYRRIDVLPPASQPPLRTLFREYGAARLAYYRKMAEPKAARVERDRALALQGRIWKQTMEAAQATGSPETVPFVNLEYPRFGISCRPTTPPRRGGRANERTLARGRCSPPWPLPC
jgi:hypothetical protein